MSIEHSFKYSNSSLCMCAGVCCGCIDHGYNLTIKSVFSDHLSVVLGVELRLLDLHGEHFYTS